MIEKFRINGEKKIKLKDFSTSDKGTFKTYGDLTKVAIPDSKDYLIAIIDNNAKKPITNKLNL